MWPKLLVVEEQDVPNLNFIINNPQELEQVSEKIIRYRLSYDFYCEDDDINNAHAALKDRACWKFLKTRSKYGYEYERVELKEFNNESCLINKL